MTGGLSAGVKLNSGEESLCCFYRFAHVSWDHPTFLRMLNIATDIFSLSDSLGVLRGVLKVKVMVAGSKSKRGK